MTDLNNVFVVGNLVREAESKATAGGLTVLRFSIANNRSKKNGERFEEYANYFDCVMMGKRADAVKQYLTKGQKVVINGELHQNRWEQDGQQRSKVEINVNDIQLVGAKSDSKPAQAPVEAVPEDDYSDLPF